MKVNANIIIRTSNKYNDLLLNRGVRANIRSSNKYNNLLLEGLFNGPLNGPLNKGDPGKGTSEILDRGYNNSFKHLA